MIENLSALSGVAYEKLGAIFPSLVAPIPAPTAKIKYPDSMRLKLGTECLILNQLVVGSLTLVDVSAWKDADPRGRIALGRL